MEKRTVFIHSAFIKLDALLKYGAVSPTGGEAKQLIEEGQVFVNGEICRMRGKKILPGDLVAIKNRVEITVGEEGK